MPHLTRPNGFYNPYLAATSGRWAEKPVFESDRLLRAAARHARRKRIPNVLRWLLGLDFSPDKRTVYHRIGVRALNDAAAARKLGLRKEARGHLAVARAARVALP